MRYGVIIERAPDGAGNVSADPPDIPGVGVTAATDVEALELLREAILWHIETMIEDGLPIPKPTTEGCEHDVEFPTRTA